MTRRCTRTSSSLIELHVRKKKKSISIVTGEVDFTGITTVAIAVHDVLLGRLK